MRPEEKGRFCFECSKKVHDLSAMTKDEAKDFLRSSSCNDICVSYQHHEDGTLVFREPAPRPAPIVPLARLRRPRSVAAAVAGVGMAMALAACAPHGDAPVRSSAAAETPVFQETNVVIPIGTHEKPEVIPPVVEDEPCDPVVEKVEQAESEPPRIRGRLKMPDPEPKPIIKRTAGKPMPRVKGDVAWVDPEAL